MLHLMLSMPAAGSDFLAWSCQTSGKQQVWKYGITGVALGAEPCWVAIRDTILERAKLCSLPPS